MKHACTLFVALVFAVSASLAAANTVSFTSVSGNTGFNLVDQDASGVTIAHYVSEMTLEELVINGQTQSVINISGVMLPNNAGAPNLPGNGRMIAIPQGATANFRIISSKMEVMDNIEIAPAPEIPFENDDSPLVYQRDPEIYNNNSFYPANPVILSDSRKLRGVDYVILGVTPFQYNPVTKQLRIYTELEVEVTFEGGNGHFGENRLRSRFWEPILRQNLVNYQTLPIINFNRAVGPTDDDDCEYIIICPDDPDFEAWADTLKNWRTLQGIITNVFTLSDIGGNNSGAIENFINDAYANWDPAPVAFLLLSDYQNSGDSYGITSPVWNGYCVSDNIYADVDGDDLPDLAHARITAQNATHLSTMIGKMLEYERTPTTNSHFYDNPVVAGGWQTERWFILCTEICYGFLHNVLGKEPIREYAIYSGSPGSQWSTNQNTYMLVNYFGPDGLGYIPATPGHLNDWGANATRINNDINDGCFMLMHRDHGSITGWGEPNYDIGDLSGLHNDDYPFVFSINCLTGMYDYGGQCFVEPFHRMEQGAVGLIGASEVSYSFVNDTYIFGMMDLMWPDFDPGYGEDGPHYPLPAFANASGKHYLEASSWPYNPQHKVYTDHLFHHHGDAFLAMYTEMPQNLTVSHANVLFTGVNYFTVTANEDALISLTVDGEIIGTGTGTGSPVNIPIEPQQPGLRMLVTITKPNYYRYTANVDVIAAQGYGVIRGRVYDAETNNNLMARVTVTDLNPPITVQCDWRGRYSVYVPADTLYHLMAEYPNYINGYGEGMVEENDTLVVDIPMYMIPVTVQMLVIHPPIIVTPGGRFSYVGVLRNETGSPRTCDLWLMLDVPGYGTYGPVKRFNNVNLAPNQQIVNWNVRQNVPGYAPLGDYTYTALVGDYPDGAYNSASIGFTVVAGDGPGSADSWNLDSWLDGSAADNLPASVSLHANYPNPFNAETVISFDLPEAGQVSLEVYNLMGQKIATLIDGNMPAGQHSVTWDASQYSSGVYFYRLAAGEKVFTRRMTLLK
jgi:hypothetical protein